MDKRCNDYDIEVHKCSIKKFERLMRKLGAKGVGKSFFVYKYNGIDISLPRTESKIAKGHKGFEVKLATDLKTACKRRDFTINALMYDLQNEQIIDFFDGLNDLETKTLKIVDTKTFQEDSLRVLRAMQFCARLGFKIQKDSICTMQKMDLSDLSHERIYKEFEKMFNAKKLYYGLYYMLQLKISKKLFDKELDFKEFYRCSKLLKQKFTAQFYDYMFIYQLRRYFNFKKLIALPNRYSICYTHPNVPANVTKKYVLAVAINYKIKDFLGNYNKKVIQYAKELSVWDHKFEAVTPQEVIAQGYTNRAISKKIKQQNLKAIREFRS